MINALADELLSAEAKAVVAQAYYTGVAAEVSILVDLNDGAVLNKEFLREIVIAGWGERLGRYLVIREVRGASSNEALRQAQLAVRNGAALFAACCVRVGNHQRCCLSVHHALADEQTLNVVGCLLKLAHTGKMELAVHNMAEGRRLYCDYVKRQNAAAKDDVQHGKTYEYSMMPVKLSKSGRLAWSEKSERVCLSCVKRIKNSNMKNLSLNAVPALLRGTGAVSDGNTLCMSRSWRSPEESGAVGMMTGLLAMPLDRNQGIAEEPQISLEACARYNSYARKALECCRASELFINGAAERGIPASQVMSSAFHVGMDIRLINASEIRLEIEGRFCSEDGAMGLLKELSDTIADEKKWLLV